MGRQLTSSREFYLLVVVEIIILAAIPFIDWQLNNNILWASGNPNPSSLIPTYNMAFMVIEVSLILPTLAVVWLLKREVWSVVAWGLALYLPLATGTEDFLYYVVGRQPWPASWPWLDGAWGVTWTRYLTSTPDVSLWGLALSAVVGWIVVVVIWAVYSESD